MVGPVSARPTGRAIQVGAPPSELFWSEACYEFRLIGPITSDLEREQIVGMFSFDASSRHGAACAMCWRLHGSRRSIAGPGYVA